MGKDWDNPDYFPLRDRTGTRKTGNGNDTQASGFGSSMAELKRDTKSRDAFIRFITDIFTEALRVLKPGGHALVWALPRTSHWTAIALEDAGFEIRDSISHLFGCLSDDTEILTSTGWVPYHKCVVGSLALCYNVNNKTLGYEPIQEVLTYDYDDTAYHIHSDYTDQIVSRNHRCIVERSGKYVFNEAESLECYERVPVLENLSDLLKALSLYGQSRGRDTGNLLPELQGTIRQNPTSTNTQDSRKSKICFPSQENLHYMRKRVFMPEPLSGKEKQDMFSGLHKQTHRPEKYRPTQACTDTNVSLVQSAIRDTEQGEGPEVLFRQVLRGMEVTGSGDAGTSQVDIHQRQRWMDSRRTSISQDAYGRYEQSSMEGGRYDLQEAWQLYWSTIREMSPRIHSNGTQGWLRYGTSSSGGSSDGPCSAQDRGCTPRKPRSYRQQDRELTAFCKQFRPQTIRASRYTSTDLAEVTPIHYKGVVWCVRVPSGAFVARRNGKVFITGNSGFPKSHNIDKAIDRLNNAEREATGEYRYASRKGGGNVNTYAGGWNDRTQLQETIPATPEAQQYAGFGTALKPSHEVWWLCRKPLSEPTIAENVLKWGVGGINIDGCRIASNGDDLARENKPGPNGWSNTNGGPNRATYDPVAASGRWPANLLLSHSLFCIDTACAEDCPIAELDRQSGNRKSGARNHELGELTSNGNISSANIRSKTSEYKASEGGASRYFKTFQPAEDDYTPFLYVSKSSRKERNAGCEELPVREAGIGDHRPSGDFSERLHRGERETVMHRNNHPTVKPVALMRYLARMITPPGGTVLDMFGGSGTTALACIAEGFNYIIIEREQEYIDIINARIAHALMEAD